MNNFRRTLQLLKDQAANLENNLGHVSVTKAFIDALWDEYHTPISVQEPECDMFHRLPAYQGSLAITHNAHKDYYESADLWVQDNSGWCQWENEESLQKALTTDSIWTIQWYPKTPVGFICLAAPTLEELLSFVASSTKES